MRVASASALIAVCLLAVPAQAVPFTYVFDGDFATSRSTLNNNGNAPISGGTLLGSVTFDTTVSAFTILDYHLETAQPNRFGGVLHRTLVDFDDQGVSGTLPVAVPKNSIVIGNNALSLLDYVSGPFAGKTWASSYARLDFTFDDSLLGAASLVFTVQDSFGPCFQDTFPLSNSCGPLAGRQNGTFTARLLTAEPPPPPAVPLPAAGGLLVAALGGLVALRRKA